MPTAGELKDATTAILDVSEFVIDGLVERVYAVAQGGDGVTATMEDVGRFALWNRAARWNLLNMLEAVERADVALSEGVGSVAIGEEPEPRLDEYGRCHRGSRTGDRTGWLPLDGNEARTGRHSSSLWPVWASQPRRPLARRGRCGCLVGKEPT
jgi:hypothetical protein